MRFAFHGTISTGLENFAIQLGRALEARGYERTEDLATANLVCNFIDRDNVRPYRRENKTTFCAAIYQGETPPADFRAAITDYYPVLVRSLSNVSVRVVPGVEARFGTMEQGNYAIPDDGSEEFFAKVAERLAPLAESHLVIDNIWNPDLEPELWDGDEVTESLTRAGQRLDALELLPAPFPIEQYLDKRDLEHVMRLYSIGGLSYGNLSARKDATRFWMSASGVDKSNLQEIGRDMLLVTDYDADAQAMVLSVPPGIEPRRVSVDAIEHWKIYMEHPEVGAIMHVHAWVDGIDATEMNYPCGTAELADAVADLVRIQPDPAHAIIGLKNHGLTITGDSLEEIFDRVEPNILRQIPMS
jgi:ribulose-5-phosphate 4-epimerase/fuculose-1-phosphate aldolase